MLLRSGFEYTFNDLLYSQFLSARSLCRKRRSVTWRRFVKSHLKGLRVVFRHDLVRPESSIPSLTRFTINPKSYSEVYRTKKWATQSLARRFVSPTGESPHTRQDSPGPAPILFETPCAFSTRTVRVSFWWKKEGNSKFRRLNRLPREEKELLILKRELFRKPYEFQPLSYPLATEAVLVEWEMVYLTPSDTLDARFGLSQPISCRPPCYCRIHSPGTWWQSEKTCISCLNYHTIIKMGEFHSDRSPAFSHTFDQHVLFCGSELARRYRRRKRSSNDDGFVDPKVFVESFDRYVKRLNS